MDQDSTSAIDRVITAEVTATPEQTLAALADLSTYPEWLGLVASATLDEPAPSDTTSSNATARDATAPAAAAAAAGQPAWIVTLRAKLGPLARSKRLRMQRVAAAADHVRFERREIDGRDHASWVLEARTRPADDQAMTTAVDVSLQYDGSFWSAPLEAALSAAEGPAARRLGTWLATQVSSAHPPDSDQTHG